MRRKQHLGIFGGTFDPIHVGHLIVAEEARARLDLDRVLFVPARVSPLKQNGEGTRFTAAERLRMVELAVADNEAFEASDVDVRRDGPSFTVDTLRLLKDELGSQTQLHFIMGMDSLETFTHWRGPQEIISLARLAVISRPGYRMDLASLEREVPGVSRAVDVIQTLEIGISATDIRDRLDRDLPIRYQVPDAVLAFVRRRSAEGIAYCKGEGPQGPTSSCC